MKTVISICAGAAALALTGCGGNDGGGATPAQSADGATGLTKPKNVTSGGRLVYVLADVSCDMEEARAKSGGVYLGPTGGAAAPAEDPVAKLARAKQMLDQGLISEAEYESVKAKILSAM